MKARLILEPEPGDMLPTGDSGIVVAEVRTLLVDPSPFMEPVELPAGLRMTYLERISMLHAAAELGREAEGQPLAVYVRRGADASESSP